MAQDAVDALLAAGQIAEAAGEAQRRGQLGRAILLYERVWDFAAAAGAAREAGDGEAELRNLLDAHELAAAIALGERLAGEGRAFAAAQVFEARRQPGEAARLFEKAGETTRAQALFARAAQHVDAGRLLEQLGDEPGAGRAYERAIADAADPLEVARAHLALGRLHARRGRNDLAARYLQEATRHDDTRVEAGRLLPRALVSLGLRDAALAALTRAREHDPSLDADLDALLGAGQARSKRSSTAAPVNDLGRLVGGRYRLGRLLGAGGSGRVHEAADVESGKTVAVKLFYAAQARGQEAYARFVREARVCGALKHGHIVEVLDFREDAGFFVMELMSGGTLADRMTPRLAPAPLRRAGLDVIAGLEAAHAAGVVHRDLKPANVFFDDRGVAKLGDFGVAHLLDLGQTQTGGLIGTLAYMAPEQVTGAPLSFTADLYALGVTLFQALTGRLPLPGPDFLAQHLGETPPLASSVWPGAAGWDALLNRLLAKDPAARHDSLAELRSELSAVDVSDARRVLVLGGAGREAPVAEAPEAETVAIPEPRPVRASTAPPSRYQHETPLGDTPLSTLVRAVDETLSRSVVIERFAEGHPDEATTRRLKALAAAQGPHLSRILTFDRATRTAVFEAPMGETLIVHLSRAPLAPRAAARLLGELSRALEPLHAAGVAHGFVAADRVLLDDSGAATLASAGLPPVGTSTPADDVAALVALVAQAAGVGMLGELASIGPLPGDVTGLAAWADQLDAVLAAGERRKLHVQELEKLAADAADEEGARARLHGLAGS